MQKYKSHKVVEAAKIAKCGPTVGLVFENGEQHDITNDWLARFKPTDDDLGYFVRYPDGYESWSPSKAFEEGYIPLEEEDQRQTQ